MMIGQTIKQYTITAKLGEGGMGQVYLAEDTNLERQVALKFLPQSMWNQADARTRLIREAKAASKLDHPNVVTIYNLDEVDGRPYIVMAYVEGSTLKDHCIDSERSLKQQLDVILQIVEGVQHAHSRGIIHRDLKPGNILVSLEGRVRILDFGIARLHGTTRLTQTGSTLGTIAYSPPEIAQGQDATVASDIYSLGVVMYEVFTGQLPFREAHEAALIYSILQETPPAPAEINPSIPDTLQSCIMRCLEKQPSDRYASCRELASDLMCVRTGNDSATAGEKTEKRPSIAVLPFANMSADPENEYFSDGLTEELLNVLAKNPELKVTGRTSSFAFKGKQEDLRRIGQKLGVEALLEGSVRKAGNRVRITVQLVKAADGFHLWTETYDRVLDDIFTIQDDIANEVSIALNVTLLGKPEARHTIDSESYALTLRAHQAAVQISAASLETAIELYQRAVDVDPMNARAWAGIGRVYLLQAGFGYMSVDTGYPRAEEHARRALELDDSSAEAHEIMGWIHMFNSRIDSACIEFRRAFELKPNDSRVVSSLAAYEGVTGNLEKSLELSRLALELDPLNPESHLNYTRALGWAERGEEAVEVAKRVIQMSPDTTSVYLHLSWSYLHAGQLEKALEAIQKEKSDGYRLCGLTIVHHALGNRAESDAAIADLIRMSDKGWHAQVATAHAYRNEPDEAFRWLKRSLELRDSGVPLSGVSPFMKNLHDDPRWPVFLKEIGLTGSE